MQKQLLIDIKDTILSARLFSSQRGHRLPVLVRVNQHEQAKAIGESLSSWFEHSIYIHQHTPLKANDIIGHEYDHVIFYLHDNFDPNLMAAISGTVKSGGIFTLLSLKKTDVENNVFQHYVLEETICNSNFLQIDVATHSVIESVMPQYAPSRAIENEPNIDRFSQQKKAIEGIKKLVSGRRKRPLVLTANRGRGKSAALGMAVGELISSDAHNNINPVNILVTGPSLAATAVIFKHIHKTIIHNNDSDPLKTRTGKISCQGNTVSFVAPDKLLGHLPPADLLIVDEAAGINLFLLERIATQYSRIAFATTLHGYEGSGQGFVTRFSKMLSALYPQWKSITLSKPIRWNSNDPLENHIEHIFLLGNDAHQANTNINGRFSPQKISVKVISKTELLGDRQQLLSLFSLLKNAHYKTSPNDLRQLMDSETVIIFMGYYQNRLVAAAIAEPEGMLSEKLIDEIYGGYRRPKGQFIPQSIVMHLGLKAAGKLRYLRIMRIAVQPGLQEKGIGSLLLEYIVCYSKKNAFDYIGCSFGATERLLKFWYKFDFRTLRIGYKKNAFNACNPALLAKPLSNKAALLSKDAKNIFFCNFICQLTASLKQLDSSIVIAILRQHYADTEAANLPSKILNDVISFASHNRSYDDNLDSISRFILNSTSIKAASDFELKLLTVKVLQKHNWSDTNKYFNFTGKKQSLSALKSSLSKILEAHS